MPPLGAKYHLTLPDGTCKSDTLAPVIKNWGETRVGADGVNGCG